MAFIFNLKTYISIDVQFIKKVDFFYEEFSKIGDTIPNHLEKLRARIR